MTAADTPLHDLLTFFRALGDETRLRIVGYLAQRERSVEELAALVELRAPTVSHHLARLKDAGVIGMRREGNTHIYWLDSAALRARSKTLLTPETTAALVDDATGAVWERKVLKDFFDGATLKEIPASRKKRAVVLRWLANQFAPDRMYPEAEVNALIQRHHPDSATLRRELIGLGLLARADGTYWRPVAPTEATDGA
jgi:hypothetical protein